MCNREEFIMVGIGEVLWDVLPGGKTLGGAPANFAYHAGQLGGCGVVISSVGDDSAGAALLAELENKQVNHYVTLHPYFPTGEVTVEMQADGTPSYSIRENVAWDHLRLDMRHRELATQCHVVCFGSLAQRSPVSAESIHQFLSATTPACIRLFDINLRQSYYEKESIFELLNLANVFKLNDEELLVVADYCGLSGNETTMLGQLEEEFKLDLIILTKAGNGSRLFSSVMGDSILGGSKLKVVDTVGAGDSFAAAVATGMCRKMNLEDIHLLATRVAAYVCQKSGATPQLPSLGQLLSPSC